MTDHPPAAQAAPISRRGFQQATAAGVAAAVVGATARAAASDRVRVGFIGLGNRGDQVLDAFLAQPDCDVVAVCDIHEPYVEFAAAKIGNAAGGRTRASAALHCSIGLGSIAASTSSTCFMSASSRAIGLPPALRA